MLGDQFSISGPGELMWLGKGMLLYTNGQSWSLLLAEAATQCMEMHRNAHYCGPLFWKKERLKKLKEVQESRSKVKTCFALWKWVHKVRYAKALHDPGLFWGLLIDVHHAGWRHYFAASQECGDEHLRLSNTVKKVSWIGVVNRQFIRAVSKASIRLAM